MNAAPLFCLGFAIWFFAASAAASGSTSVSEVDTADELLKLRDPFLPAEMTAVDRKVSELERYPVTDFKMIGALTGPDRIRAMLTTGSDGKTHFVTEKMKIGQRGGVIMRIGADSVTIREKSLNVLGKEEIEDIVLKLNLDGNQLGKVSVGQPKPLRERADANMPARPLGANEGLQPLLNQQLQQGGGLPTAAAAVAAPAAVPQSVPSSDQSSTPAMAPGYRLRPAESKPAQNAVNTDNR